MSTEWQGIELRTDEERATLATFYRLRSRDAQLRRTSCDRNELADHYVPRLVRVFGGHAWRSWEVNREPQDEATTAGPSQGKAGLFQGVGFGRGQAQGSMAPQVRGL